MPETKPTAIIIMEKITYMLGQIKYEIMKPAVVNPKTELTMI